MTESTTAPTPPSTRTQRIVILGGGFAGVTTAQELTRRLRSQGRLAGRRRPAGRARDGPAALPPVSVTLINRDNYFVFQPLLADIISGAIETTHVVVPLRRMLPGADVEVGHVEAIDPAAREVHVRRRLGGAPFTVGYDALVVALGSVTDFGAVPGMAEYALGVRSLGDAFYLRNHALSMLEEAAHEDGSRAATSAPDVRRGRWWIDRRGGRGRARGSLTHGAPDVCDPTGADGRPRSQPCTRPVRVRGTPRPACHEEPVPCRCPARPEAAARTGRSRPGRARRRDDHRDRHRGEHGRQRAASGRRSPRPSPRRSRDGSIRMPPSPSPGSIVSGRSAIARRSSTPDGSADAGDRAARRPRRSSRRAEHPRHPRRRPAAPVRLRPAGHARLARSI